MDVGGIATQTFTVSLIAAPPNRPPVITSVPVTKSVVAVGTQNNVYMPTLKATVRDFQASQSDFEDGISGHVTGLVASELGATESPFGWDPMVEVQFASAASFQQWFNDIPGTNLSKEIELPLQETSVGSGVYQFVSNAFFPIDGELFGTKGAATTSTLHYKLTPSSYIEEEKFSTLPATMTFGFI